MKRYISILLLLYGLFSVFPIHTSTSKSKLPVIVTTAGQGMGFYSIMEDMAYTNSFEEYYFPFDFSKIVNSKQLEEGVGISSIPKFGPLDSRQYYFNSYSVAPLGTPYNTIIFSIEYFAAFDHNIYELDTHVADSNFAYEKTSNKDYALRIRDMEYEYERIILFGQKVIMYIL